jgi:large repetitive protein
VSWATSPANVRSGEVLRYTLTVRNNGPDAATQVVVTATFSPGLPSFPEGFECVDAESEIICTIPTLAAGTSEILVFDTYYVGGPYTAFASVSTQTPDPDPDNNSANASYGLGSGSGCGGCGDCGSCDIGGGARVPGGLIWGAMVMLALRRRRRR